MNVAVIGGSECSKKSYQLAEKTGRLIARQGWVLICGGGPAVMEAACWGAKKEKGLTVGILAASDASQANAYLDVKIPTGFGYARNLLVVRAADYLIAISGKYGTLSEAAFALAEGKKVFGLNTWKIKGIIKVKTPEEVIAKIKQDVKQKSNRKVN